MFLSWRLPSFFYLLGWGDLVFVTPLIYVTLILILSTLVSAVSTAINSTTEFDWPEHLASFHAASVSCHESVKSQQMLICQLGL